MLTLSKITGLFLKVCITDIFDYAPRNFPRFLRFLCSGKGFKNNLAAFVYGLTLADHGRDLLWLNINYTVDTIEFDAIAVVAGLMQLPQFLIYQWQSGSFFDLEWVTGFTMTSLTMFLIVG